MKLALVGAVAAIVTSALTAGVVLHERAAGPYPSTFRGVEEPPGITLPAFTLRSYDGRIVDASSLRGKVAILTFLDTKCNEACPIVATVVAQAVDALMPDERRDVVAVAITSDPRVDTPAAIRAFLGRRHALGRIDYLSGPIPTLERIWRSFLVLSSFDSGDADVHSAPVRVYSRGGEWLATEHVGVDLTSANLVHDVRVAMRR